MGKRKTQKDVSYDDFIDDASDSDEDFVVAEKPKKGRKAQKKEGSGSPADTPSKRKSPVKAPPRPKVTERTQTEDGWTLLPPSLIYRIGHDQPSEKIAAFDFDGTLATNKSGAVFATGPTDWQLYNSTVPEKVQEYASKGYKIVIFSNQGGIKGALNGKQSDNQRSRFNGLIGKLGVTVTAFMATQQDGNRKPGRGMWDAFVREGNSGQAPDLAQSFFVGDAAGRDYDPVGNSDAEFAAAIGIEFKTPEDVFGPVAPPGTISTSGPNADLASILLQLANVHNDNIFKSRAFKKAADVVEGCTELITSEPQVKKMKLPGVGKGCLAVIKEYFETGKVAALDPVKQADAAAVAEQQAAAKAQGDAFAFL